MPDDDLVDVTEFTCPRCGSHAFGTNLPTDTGYCHKPCGFTWPRRNDAKYFRNTGEQISGWMFSAPGTRRVP